MSTHNIGFYEDLTKIIFELSSNIIKYAPYFFCCHHDSGTFVKLCLFVSLRKQTYYQPSPVHWLNYYDRLLAMNCL